METEAALMASLAGKLGLIGEQTVDADALAQTLRQQLARGGVEQLILQEEEPALMTRTFISILLFPRALALRPNFR